MENYTLQRLIDIVFEYAVEQKRTIKSEKGRRNIELWVKAKLFELLNSEQTPERSVARDDHQGDGDGNKPLTQCMIGRDAECNHPKCPVTDEDVRNGRYCTLPIYDWRT